MKEADPGADANRVTIPPSETEARARAAEVRAGEATELIQLKLLYQLILDWELPLLQLSTLLGLYLNLLVVLSQLG